MASAMQPLHQSKTMYTKPGMENRKSILLDEEENSIILALLGRKCLSLSTAVVQLLVTLPPQHIKWNHKCTGVVCFVKDNPKRSYFIRVYDFERREIVWEQELYNTFDYKEQRPFFHTFEADNCMAGLNFSNDNEAKHFAETVKGKLQNRLVRLQEKKSSSNHSSNFQPSIQPTDQGLIMPSKAVENKGVSKDNRKQGKKKFTKEDIGMPTNFQHIHHIGWNSQTNNFEANKEIFKDTNLLNFLQTAGVTQDQLNDKSTVKFIYDFLDQHGGRDKALAEIENPPPLPPVPPVALPNYNTNNHSKINGSYPSVQKSSTSVPPPVPPQSHQHIAHKPVAPSVPAPAPPPPPPPPPPMAPVPAAPAASVSVAPPPPPPPPPSFAPIVAPSAPKASPSANALPSSAPDSHSALMDAIRKGSTLNHVEPSEAPSNSTSSGGSGGGEDIRDQLMNQIRRGMALKKVEPNANKPDASNTPNSGLAGALARALQERSRALNQTDDSSDSDSHSSDDEWD